MLDFVTLLAGASVGFLIRPFLEIIWEILGKMISEARKGDAS